MQQTHRPLPWNEPQLKALALVFDGRLSQARVAEAVNTPLRTLVRWLAHPDFKARLAEMRTNLMVALEGLPYVTKTQRIHSLSQMAESARCAYEAQPWIKDVRPTADGEITNEHFNKDAFDAFREALADIAAELGARKNVTELTGSMETTQRVVFYMPQPEIEPSEDEL